MADDAAVVLAHVIADGDAVNEPVRGLHQAEARASIRERADHPQRVERKLLEELARPFGSGPSTAFGSLLTRRCGASGVNGDRRAPGS